MEKIRKGDEVIVIAGRDKGKRGVVLDRIDASHVRVEGVNQVKKHLRPNPMKNVTGGIVDRTLPIDQTNVMLVNPASGKGERIAIRLVDGRKRRVFKSDGKPVADRT